LFVAFSNLTTSSEDRSFSGLALASVCNSASETPSLIQATSGGRGVSLATLPYRRYWKSFLTVSLYACFVQAL
jgi:hypothetical protein